MVARFYNVPQGLLVTDVAGESAAEAAGIQKNDIILELDGKEVTSVSTINNILKQHKVGDQIAIKYYRNGKTLSGTLPLEENGNGKAT